MNVKQFKFTAYAEEEFSPFHTYSLYWKITSKLPLRDHVWTGPFDFSKIFQRVALLHSSGLQLCYWILLCASRVYKSKKIWFASNVSLVERESCAPLIQLVNCSIQLQNHGLKSDIKFCFFKCKIIFFRRQTLHAGDPARCRRTLSPVGIMNA